MITNERIPTDLKTGDFFYDLPEELIAQTPADPRDSSRLLLLDRETQSLSERTFRDIADFIRPEDVLVINDSRVIPARLYGTRESGAQVEILLLRQLGQDTWETLVRPGKKARPGDVVTFSGGALTATVEALAEEGNRIVRFRTDGARYKTIYEALHDVGTMPLPPYITKKLEDQERYQTVYAKEEGSSAAPTAGLHFTEALLDKIRAQGTAIAPVMLHVGLGTFRPVKADAITDHVMHSEFITVSEESAHLINTRRANGGRIIAVGTTSARTLESAADENGIVHPVAADTGIFIYPGYRWKAVDALITNFHLPESTLLMLVSSFAGKEFTFRAYEHAVRERFRFFSFGDAMLIL